LLPSVERSEPRSEYSRGVDEKRDSRRQELCADSAESRCACTC
jgi:hypothetical protein